MYVCFQEDWILFCGAIRLLEEGGSPCLVGHNEYPKLAKRQNLFVRTFQDLYPEQSVKFISFTANSRAPISEKEGILKGRRKYFSWQVITVFYVQHLAWLVF